MGGRQPRSVARDRLLGAALVLYLAMTAWFTLGPVPEHEVASVGQEIRDVGSVVSRTPVDQSEPAPSSEVALGMTAEETSNLLLFVPVPVLVAARWPQRRWIGLPAGVALSASIELTQLLVLEHRSAQWNDVRWNSTGAVVGAALCAAVVALRRRPSKPDVGSAR